ncbi:hypothetical protein MB02_07650 [Croceicoccus estronivorus]|nr:hypothetical protein MB02_07650 [Croceicoccus estronivorus]
MRLIALLAAATLFMESLDGTIVAIALPEMARYFRADVVDMNLGITAYLVALAVVLPISTWASDRWGPRKVFAAAIAGFTLTSLACAASQSMEAFVVARTIQGASAAMMTPVGRVVVLRHTERSGMMNAVALLTWPALIAPAIAPPLGGLIVKYLNWQWIFLVNVPLGLIGVVAALRLLPDSIAADDGERRSQHDWTGLILWAIAATLLIGGIESAARLSPSVLAFVLACGFGAAFTAWRHFRHHSHPVLDINLVGRHRSFGAVIFEGSAFRAAIMANPFLLPLYFQVGLHKTIGETGLLIMIGMIGNIGMKTVTSPVLRAFGFRRVLLCNGLLLGGSFAALILTDAQTPFAVIAGILIVSGLCRSMQFTTLNTLAFAEIVPSDVPHANTLLTTALQTNGAMGVAIGALALQIGSRFFGDGSEATFHLGFAVIATIAILAALSCLRLDHSIGSALISHERHGV